MNEPITIIAWNKSVYLTARLVFFLSLVILGVVLFFYFLSWVNIIGPIPFFFALPPLLFTFFSGFIAFISLIHISRCQKVYIFTNKRLSIIIRNYQWIPTLMHLFFHTNLNEQDHTEKKEEPTYQLKYITKWNQRSEMNILLNVLLVKMIWHYTQRGNPGEVEEIITDEIRVDDWQNYKQGIFDWIEQERSLVDVRDASLPY